MNGPEEFRDLSNVNFATPGALTKRPGTDLYLGATIAGRITGGVEFERLNGASYIVATANTNAYTVTSSWNAFRTGLLNDALFDFVTFVDRLFAANGQDFFKFDGTNTSNYSLPPGSSGFGLTAVLGIGLSGTFLASYGYQNDRGYYGPPATPKSITLDGVTFGTIGYVGLTTPAGYGISALQFYRTSAGGADLTGTTFTAAGATYFTDNAPLSALLGGDQLFFTLAPRYLEIYNNQLFMAGFSSLPSTVFWSEIGEPESVDPEFNAEFRTNDGDRVTGLKTYNGSLFVSKERSFHRVTGDNPDNFLLQEVSDQYGCISNRAMVVFESRFWFLDPKGIAEYDGANVKIVSNKVEDIFTAMNLSAARENATAIHARQFNEVWFSIPCYGATINNCIVVYDYLTQAWTHYDGISPSVLFLAKGSRPAKTPFFGGYTGTMSYFSASLMGDAGRAITCVIDSRFYAARDQTTESMYRRFYANFDPIPGSSQAIDINLRSNYGTTIQVSRTMYQNPFQTRIDFGISARSIQAEIIHASATLPFKLDGFAFESRFQRAV